MYRGTCLLHKIALVISIYCQTSSFTCVTINSKTQLKNAIFLSYFYIINILFIKITHKLAQVTMKELTFPTSYTSLLVQFQPIIGHKRLRGNSHKELGILAEPRASSDSLPLPWSPLLPHGGFPPPADDDGDGDDSSLRRSTYGYTVYVLMYTHLGGEIEKERETAALSRYVHTRHVYCVFGEREVRVAR